MPFFGKKFGSVYLEIFRTIFIHLGKQIAYRYLVYVDGRLIIGDTFIISIIYLYNDSQLGKQIKYVCREADGDTVGIRQFVCRIRFLSFDKPFYDKVRYKQRKKILVSAADVLAVTFKTELFYVL